MKLYFSPGACSLAPHIVLVEAGIDCDLEKVDLKTKTTASGADYTAINPKGYVPALALDDGTLITECPAVVQYLADRKPEARLAPPAGTMERYRLQEWLNFVSSELHKTVGPLFAPNASDERIQIAIDKLERRLNIVVAHLNDHEFLVGERFTAADAYLFVVLNWTVAMKLAVAEQPVLRAYRERIASRPAVVAAMQQEGLTK